MQIPAVRVNPAQRFGGLFVLIAGALAVTAFAPLAWSPLAILSLAILFNQWLLDNPPQAFRHGALFGLGFFGAGISWVYVSVHTYGHVPLPAASLVAAALVVVLALFPALLGYLLKRMAPGRSWWVMVAVFPAGWVLAEWLRGWLFTGLPWLTIGTSQVDFPLAGFATLLGNYGVGWVTALSAALLLAFLRGQARIPSLALLCALWLGGYLADRVEWTGPRGAALQVALVQGNISQENKWAPENLLHTLERYSALTFAQQDKDLIVWPETAIPAFYHQVEDNFIPYLETELQTRGSTLLTGIPLLDMSEWRYYNSIMTIGAARRFYRKQHLVPFGEYLPFRALLGDRLDALAVPNADFSAGDHDQALLEAAGVPVGSSICFEIVFGAEIIRVLPEAALLVNVSNDAWFGDSLAPHQHLEMARMRAKETGRPLLRATNTGISAIIDHRGRIMARSPQFEEAVVTGSVVPQQGATPYVRFGNLPVLLLALASLLAGWFGSLKKYNSHRRDAEDAEKKNNLKNNNS
jgi:apolipoprotein N-acyltransferase